MALYIVKGMKKLSWTENWTPVESYAVGNTCKEAIDFIKHKFRGHDSDYKDFNAVVAAGYSGTYEMYRVRYAVWNVSFSVTHPEEILVVGRSEDEAICYAKAYAPADAMGFSALKVTQVCGRTITVEQ